MKIKRSKYLYTTWIIVLVLAIGLISYSVYKSYGKASSHAPATSSPTTKKTVPAADNNMTKQNKTNSSGASISGSGTSVKKSNTSSVANYTVLINVVSPGNNTVHIGTQVSGTSIGSCTITAYKAGQPTLTLATGSVKMDVNAYDCGTYNIPTSKFTSSGTWQITLTVSNNGMTATDSSNVSI